MAMAQTWVPEKKSGETNLVSVCFQDKDTGYAVSGNKVLRTTDAGKTWNRILNSYNKFSGIMFSDKINGVIIGENDLVLKTSDGGQNWSLIRTGNSDDDFLAVYTRHKDTIYVLGPDDMDTYKFANYLNYSYNGGASWTRYSTGSTQTIRSIQMWNKHAGTMGTLTSGVFKTTNEWGSYNVNWPNPSIQIIDHARIKDSVIVLVGNNGRISRSNDYGVNFSLITSPISSGSLWDVDFVNDSFGMICGDNGVILVSRNAGLSWSQMTTNTKLNFRKLSMLNPYYGWAVAATHQDSFNIFKFGSETYIADKINFITGSLSVDLDKNCVKDGKQLGPAGVLIRALPGPHYTYTEANGNFSMVVPDTGHFTIDTRLPKKYQLGKGLCDTAIGGIYFKTFERTADNKNFMFESDTSVNLEIKMSSARKRRCFKNENVLTFKNIGFSPADSVEIKVFYPADLIDIKSTSMSSSKQKGVLTFNLGKLTPGSGGSITIIDSVLCQGGVMGRTVCFYAVITPRILVKNTTWDSSWVRTRIDCLNDSLAIVKIFNTGKAMKDTAVIDLYKDDVLSGELKYRLPAGDSLRFEVERVNKTITVIGDVKTHHPYQELMRAWKERCGNDTLVGNQNFVTRFQMQSLPSFETEICLPIRDSYDPNDIAVTPSGRGAEHFIPNLTQLEYLIRFQNTGNDTAYNIYILDTLTTKLDPRSIEIIGSSHAYKYKVIGDSGSSILRFDFENIMLVDSFTNEPGSNGWVSFRIMPAKKFPHRTRIDNFVDIYFDFNTPVRTNTAFVSMYDTVITKPGNKIFVPCESRLTKKITSAAICDKLATEQSIAFTGKYKPFVYSKDTTLQIQKMHDTLYRFTASKAGVYMVFTAIQDCDLLLVDSVTLNFTVTPTVNLSDSLHCGSVSQILRVTCQDCQFLWSDLSNADSLVVNSAGTYGVTLKNGCAAVIDSAEISLLLHQTLHLGNDTIICDGGDLTLQPGVPSAGLTWWDQTQTSSKRITQAGVYSAHYTDACNDLNDTIIITQKNSPTGNQLVDSLHCGDVLQTLSVTCGDCGFVWSDNSKNNTLQVSSAGSYSVTLKNACGTVSDTAVIGSMPLLKLDLGKDTLVCDQGELWLNPAIPSTGLKWWDAGTGGKKKITTAGIYWASYSDRCNALSDTIEVKLGESPKFDLGDDISVCGQPDFIFYVDSTKSGISILWDDFSTFFSKTMETAGIYTATLTNICGSVKDSVAVIAHSIPVPYFALGDHCKISSTNFNNKTDVFSSGPWRYTWDFNGEGSSTEKDPVFDFKQPGKKRISLTVETEAGCKDSMVLSLDMKNQLKTDFGLVDETICDGDTVVFKNLTDFNSRAVQYTWRFGDGTQSDSSSPKHVYPFKDQSRTYLVTLLADAGQDCRDSVILPVDVNALPDAKFSFSKNGSNFEFVPNQIQSASEYQWSFSNGYKQKGAPLNVAASLVSTPGDSFNVCLIVTDLNGCVSKKQCQSYNNGLGFSSMQRDFMHIYPNPTHGVIQVVMPDGRYAIKISDMLGAVVHDTHIAGKDWNHQFESFQKGVFLIQLTNESGLTVTQRVVVH
jgi:photosystem II stability/assembly factor-like uncharacterized protein